MISNFLTGFNHRRSSTTFYSESNIVESCQEMLNCYVFNFRTYFLKKYLSQRKFESTRFKVLMKLFFDIATVAMITEKLSCSYFHGTIVRETNYLMKIMQFVNPNYP